METQSAKVTEVSREATHAQAQTKHMMNIEVLLKGEVPPPPHHPENTCVAVRSLICQVLKSKLLSVQPGERPCPPCLCSPLPFVAPAVTIVQAGGCWLG